MSWEDKIREEMMEISILHKQGKIDYIELVERNLDLLKREIKDAIYETQSGAFISGIFKTRNIKE